VKQTKHLDPLQDPEDMEYSADRLEDPSPEQQLEDEHLKVLYAANASMCELPDRLALIDNSGLRRLLLPTYTD
jgi:hypothetical protein